MLKLDINAEGRIVLKGVTDEAWEYIERERNKLYDADHRHWYFSRERFEDTVYITVTPKEDKTAFFFVFDKLIAQFGLETSPAAKHVLEAWRKDAENAKDNAARFERTLQLERKIDRLSRLCKEGCKSCPNFRVERSDDSRGICVGGERPVYLRQTVWSPIRKDKYYPHENCKYLNER